MTDKKLKATLEFDTPVLTPKGIIYQHVKQKMIGTMSEISFWVNTLKEKGNMENIEVKFVGNK